RRIDPTLAAKYHRLMIDAGKHHNSALCHIATKLLTRIIPCWRAEQPTQLRDVDGPPVTIDQARAIIAERYAIPKDLRARRKTTDTAGTDRRNKEPPSAPPTGTSNPNATPPPAASPRLGPPRGPVLAAINCDHGRRHDGCTIDRHNPPPEGVRRTRRVNARSSKESDGSLLTPPEMFGKRTALGHISQTIVGDHADKF